MDMQHAWSIADQRGTFRSFGMAGGITGLGASVILIDDPIKNAAEANSPVLREKLFDIFCSDVLTRLEPVGPASGKIILTMSRRNIDDINSRIRNSAELANFGMDVLRLPALSEGPGDPLGRPEGAALSTRFSAEELLQVKKFLESSEKSHQWECLYAQNPVGDPAARTWTDEYFKAFWYDEINKDLNCRYHVVSVDPSKGGRAHSKLGDYCAYTDIHMMSDNIAYCDATMVRLAPDAIEDMVAARCEQSWQDKWPITHCRIETNGDQIKIKNNIQARLRNKRCPTIVSGVESAGEKVVRISEGLGRPLAQGRIKYKKGSAHNRIAYGQFLNLGSAQHDDGPDSCHMGITLLSELISGRPAGGVSQVLRV
jgi:hypothetical protein